MKFFVLAACVALAAAAPTAFLAPTVLTAAPVATAPLISQYHSQDELGQYTYGYTGGLSSKSEARAIDGVTRGAYTFLDADGKVQSVQYTADAINGFRAVASNMPVAPVETRSAPLPVAETPEVAKARADFLVAFEEAKIRAAAEPETINEEAKPAAKAAEPTPEAAAPTPAPAAAAPAPVTNIATPVFRTVESHPFAFNYAYSSPLLAYNPYTLGYPFNYNHGGFRALPYTIPAPIAPLALPQPVAETPEVAQARAEHLAAHAKARAHQ